MKLAIIGATGRAGRAAFKEAQSQGIDVTAIVHDPNRANEILGSDAKTISHDIMELTQEDLSGFDAIADFSALQPAYLNLDSGTKLISMFRENKDTRLFFVIGSSSLIDENGATQLSHTLEKFAGEPWLDIPIEHMHKLDFLKMVNNVQWVAMTPQDDFVEGPKTEYQIGTNHPLADKNGKFEVSTGNFAAAFVDELLHPAHNQEQFTVADK